uniref:RNA helicase aquarius insertion domain-containing protein n=1 Tax=Salmo trutta TaxID=8032 RepID=A0A673Z2N1_SALTR
MSCFPGYTVKVTKDNPELLIPAFRIKFNVQNRANKGKRRKADEEKKEEGKLLIVEPHVTPNRGPYPYKQAKQNTIQFTPTQIEAIHAGMQPGPTMVRTFTVLCLPLVSYGMDVVYVVFRYGHVNYVLARRLELLSEMGSLQERGLSAAVLSLPPLQVMVEAEAVSTHFPFHKYFSNAPQPVFHGRSYEEDIYFAEGCYQHIKKIFSQLEEFCAFELLMNGLDRSKYLLVGNSTLTLLFFCFQYDNILMEDARTVTAGWKRWIMIGDHQQLPPVIKNMAFQKYSNMEHPLRTPGYPPLTWMTRDVPSPPVCNLYNWRYKQLGNLPHVQLLPQFQAPNPGLTFDFQLLNVEDFNGVGESEPNPYFYQNLGEAEYCVALFMYMRLLGYPADRINILTTYNRKKHLIRDVINQRCDDGGYIILSLVRTRAVGHLWDVRRLVVAMSRSRLDIFARVSLFQNCFELSPAFNQLTARPMKLHIRPNEYYTQG